MGPAAISRDGRQLSFVSGSRAGPLWLRDLARNQTRRLTFPSPYPEYAAGTAWSPDGKSVAYRWFNQSFVFELRALVLASGESRVLYTHPKTTVTSALEWSPDSQHIAAVLLTPELEMQLSLVSVADGSVRTLKTFPGPAPRKISFSPDGRYLAYDRSPNREHTAHDVFLLSSDGKLETHLIAHPADDFVLGWTPGGNEVLFASDRAGSVGAWIAPVSAGEPRGAPRLVKPDLGAIAPLGFSENGSYYYALERTMSNVFVAELDVETGTVRSPAAPVSLRFEGSHEAPDWSPDGRSLAYLFQRQVAQGGEEKWGLAIRHLQTGEERDLPLRVVAAGDLRWSPDGRFFAATCKLADRGGICRIAAQSGEVSLIVEGPGVGHTYIYRPSWSPDGKAVFYARNDWDKKLYRFFRRDLETGRDVELYRVVAPAAAGSPTLAPDGRQLAFFSRDQATRESLLNLMDTEERKPRLLLRTKRGDSPCDVAWTPDGRYLLFAKCPPQKGELWRIPAEGGTAERIELKADNPRGLRPHPDGRRIAFLDGTAATEIWALENFLPPR